MERNPSMEGLPDLSTLDVRSLGTGRRCTCGGVHRRLRKEKTQVDGRSSESERDVSLVEVNNSRTKELLLG